MNLPGPLWGSIDYDLLVILNELDRFGFMVEIEALCSCCCGVLRETSLLDLNRQRARICSKERWQKWLTSCDRLQTLPINLPKP